MDPDELKMEMDAFMQDYDQKVAEVGIAGDAAMWTMHTLPWKGPLDPISPPWVGISNEWVEEFSMQAWWEISSLFLTYQCVCYCTTTPAQHLFVFAVGGLSLELESLEDHMVHFSWLTEQLPSSASFFPANLYIAKLELSPSWPMQLIWNVL